MIGEVIGKRLRCECLQRQVRQRNVPADMKEVCLDWGFLGKVWK